MAEKIRYRCCCFHKNSFSACLRMGFRVAASCLFVLLVSCGNPFTLSGEYVSRQIDSLVYEARMSRDILTSLYSGNTEEAVELLETQIDNAVILSWEELQHSNEKEYEKKVCHINRFLESVKNRRNKYPRKSPSYLGEDQIKEWQKRKAEVDRILGNVQVQGSAGRP